MDGNANENEIDALQPNEVAENVNGELDADDAVTFLVFFSCAYIYI